MKNQTSSSSSSSTKSKTTKEKSGSEQTNSIRDSIKKFADLNINEQSMPARSSKPPMLVNERASTKQNAPDDVHVSDGWMFGGQERKFDRDGYLHTKAEFVDLYGSDKGADEWNNAPPYDLPKQQVESTRPVAKKYEFHPLFFPVMTHAVSNHVVWGKRDLENLFKALELVEGGGPGCIGQQVVKLEAQKSDFSDCGWPTFPSNVPASFHLNETRLIHPSIEGYVELHSV